MLCWSGLNPALQGYKRFWAVLQPCNAGLGEAKHRAPPTLLTLRRQGPIWAKGTPKRQNTRLQNIEFGFGRSILGLDLGLGFALFWDWVSIWVPKNALVFGFDLGFRNMLWFLVFIWGWDFGYVSLCFGIPKNALVFGFDLGSEYALVFGFDLGSEKCVGFWF